MKTACLIIIGNEILSGRTADKNLSWLARELNECGIRVGRAVVIPDVPQDIVRTVNECRSQFDVVFTTGGIGPTHDDITSACIAQAFGVSLIRHPQAEAILEKHYGRDQLNAARLKMADMPQGATLVENPVSAAPGFRIGNVYVFAGVPSIMQAMFANIRHELGTGPKMLSATISAFVTEGILAEGLTQIQNEFAEVEIGSYPFFQHGRLGTSIVMRSTDANLLQRCHDRVQRFFAETLKAEFTDAA